MRSHEETAYPADATAASGDAQTATAEPHDLRFDLSSTAESGAVRPSDPELTIDPEAMQRFQALINQHLQRHPDSTTFSNFLGTFRTSLTQATEPIARTVSDALSRFQTQLSAQHDEDSCICFKHVCTNGCLSYGIQASCGLGILFFTLGMVVPVSVSSDGERLPAAEPSVPDVRVAMEPYKPVEGGIAGDMRTMGTMDRFKASEIGEDAAVDLSVAPTVPEATVGSGSDHSGASDGTAVQRSPYLRRE